MNGKSYLVQGIVTAFFTLIGAFALYKFVITPNQFPARTFSVEGIAKEDQAPQIVSTDYSIQETGTTQKEAQDKGNVKQQAANKVLTALGFKKEDIKTTGYYINEDFEYSLSGIRSSRGYIINIITQIKSKDVTRINQAIDQLATLGINIGGVNYTTETNSQVVTEKSRAAAIKDAKEKAQAIAKAAGFKMGEIVSISEWTDAGQNYPGPYYDTKSAIGGSAPTEIQPGTTPVVLHVTITYAIQ